MGITRRRHDSTDDLRTKKVNFGQLSLELINFNQGRVESDLAFIDRRPIGHCANYANKIPDRAETRNIKYVS